MICSNPMSVKDLLSHTMTKYLFQLVHKNWMQNGFFDPQESKTSIQTFLSHCEYPFWDPGDLRVAFQWLVHLQIVFREPQEPQSLIPTTLAYLKRLLWDPRGLPELSHNMLIWISGSLLIFHNPIVKGWVEGWYVQNPWLWRTCCPTPWQSTSFSWF